MMMTVVVVLTLRGLNKCRNTSPLFLLLPRIYVGH